MTGPDMVEQIIAETVKQSGLPGQITADGHKLAIRIYYEDTDAAGVVYHSNYLKFAERGRTEALYALGWDQQRLYEEDGIVFVVRHCEVDYCAPARLGEIVEICTRLAEIGGSRFLMEQTVTKDAKILVAMKIMIVTVGRNGRPTRVPDIIRQSMAGLQIEQV